MRLLEPLVVRGRTGPDGDRAAACVRDSSLEVVACSSLASPDDPPRAPVRTGPTVDPVRLSALPRRVGRSVGALRASAGIVGHGASLVCTLLLCRARAST